MGGSRNREQKQIGVYCNLSAETGVYCNLSAETGVYCNLSADRCIL